MERQGRQAKGGGKEVKQEEEKACEERISEGNEQRDILREYLGGLSRAGRREEIANMSLEE